VGGPQGGGRKTVNQPVFREDVLEGRCTGYFLVRHGYQVVDTNEKTFQLENIYSEILLGE
jgi:hypothetical protein